VTSARAQLSPSDLPRHAQAKATSKSGVREPSLRHLRFDLDTVEDANCIPCRMPYITSMFMLRKHGDRPLPVPLNR